MKTPRFLAVLTAFLFAIDCAAQTPVLIKDVNPTPNSFYINYYGTGNTYKKGRDFMYIASDHGDTRDGAEYWRTDGTAEGTIRLTDMNAGPTGSVLMLGVDLDGTFIFPGWDNSTIPGFGLWKTDGTVAGTTFVTTPLAEGDKVVFRAMIEFQGKVIFLVTNIDGTAGYIGVTDGTAAGTEIVKKIDVGPDASFKFFNELHVVKTSQAVFFNVLAKNTTTSQDFDQLWRTDGTELGTYSLPADQRPNSMIASAGDKVFFIKGGVDLWKTDGTALGTEFVFNFFVPTTQSLYSFNDKVIIAGFGTWVSDGTPAGTQQITNFTFGGFWGTAVKGGLFFAIRDDITAFPAQRKLMVSDGTPVGTFDVQDLDESVFVIDQIPVLDDGKILMPFYTPQTGLELGWTGGPFQQVTVLKDINPGPEGSTPFAFGVYNGKLFFVADDGTNGKQLWISDGTPEGTQMIVDTQPGTASSVTAAEEFPVLSAGGEKFFFATNDANPYDLFKINDNPLDAVKLEDGDKLQPLGAVGDKVFYTDFDKVMMTDAAGNDVLLKNYNIGQQVELTNYNFKGVQLGDKYVMELASGATEQRGVELWVTDGTEAGTMFLEINPGPLNGVQGENEQAKIDASTILFAGDNGSDGFELWRTDGTGFGTTMVADLRPGPDSSNPRGFFADNGIVYFKATDGTSAKLWRSDGTPLGTFVVKDFAVQDFDIKASYTKMGDDIYFFARTDPDGWGLWKTDGTEEGTEYIVDINPPGTDTQPEQLMTSSGMLFYVGVDAVHGRELHVSDGTPEGTRILDIIPGAAGSIPKNLCAVPGGIYFTSASPDEDVNGIWRTAGTEATTERIVEKAPQIMTKIDDDLYFAVDLGPHGTEYYKITPTKFNQTITFDPIAAVLPGTTSINIVASSNSGLPVTLESSSNTITLAGTTATINSPGRASITATQPGNTGFNAATPVSQSFCINPTKPTLTFSNANPLAPTLTSSAATNRWYVDGVEIPNQTGNVLIIEQAGNFTAKAAVDDCLSEASDVHTFAKQNQTIAMTLSSHVFSEGSFELQATTSSGLAATFSVNNGHLTINGNTATINAAGSVTVTATQAGNAIINPITTSQTICINPPKPVISRNGGVLTSSFQFGNQWYFNGAEMTGEVNQQLTTSTIGAYTVKSTVEGCVGLLSEVFTIDKNPQTITFTAADHEFSEGSFTLSATASSTLPVSFSTDGDKVTISGNTATIVKPGKASLIATQTGDAFFELATSQVTICINPIKPEITKSGDVLTSNAASGTQWYVDGVAIAGATNKDLTISRAGSFTARTIIDGCVSLASSAIVVDKKPQTITFGPADHNFAEGTFTLVATSTSGLPVSFETTSSKITISGSTVTINAGGQVTITARQAGDALFAAAPNVPATICINPPKPTITQSGAVLTSSALTGNQWILDGLVIGSATTRSITITSAGAYTVRVITDGCVGAPSDAVTISGVENSVAEVSFYPNPVKDVLHIQSPTPADVEIVNALGQSVDRIQSKGDVDLPVSHYHTGVYILRVTVNNSIFLRKFLKE